MKEKDSHTHPAYGLISFSRVSGDPGPLFGSKIGHHESYIRMNVSQATMIVDPTSGEERTYGPMRGTTLEVMLSAAQFAELITTMGIGMGVPCTLYRVLGEVVEPMPKKETEAVRVRGSFRRVIEKATAKAQNLVAEAKEILAKKSILAADKADLIDKMNSIVLEITSNAPFMLTLFEEATEKVTKAAKAEVDSLLTHNLFMRGLEAAINEEKTKRLGALEVTVVELEAKILDK